MVRLCTNRPEYRNAIAAEIRQFLGLVDVSVSPEPAAGEAALTLTVELVERGGRFVARASVAGRLPVEVVAALPQPDPLERKRQEKHARTCA